MNRYFKLGALAASLGLAGLTHTANAAILYTNTAGEAAGAAIGSGDGLGSSFLFVALDGNGKSYLKSVDLRMNAVTTQTTPLSFNLPGLAAFFSGSTDAVWRIFAADTVGSGNFGGRGLSVGRDTTSNLSSFLNSATATQGNQLRNFLNTADGNFDPTPVAGQALTSTATSDLWNVANLNFTVGNSSQALTNNSLLYLWNITSNGTVATTQSNRTLTAATWTLNLAGDQLNFNVPAPVPVPAAVWLLGSALATVAGLRRRRATAL